MQDSQLTQVVSLPRNGKQSSTHSALHLEVCLTACSQIHVRFLTKSRTRCIQHPCSACCRRSYFHFHEHHIPDQSLLKRWAWLCGPNELDWSSKGVCAGKRVFPGCEVVWCVDQVSGRKRRSEVMNNIPLEHLIQLYSKLLEKYYCLILRDRADTWDPSRHWNWSRFWGVLCVAPMLASWHIAPYQNHWRRRSLRSRNLPKCIIHFYGVVELDFELFTSTLRGVILDSLLPNFISLSMCLRRNSNSQNVNRIQFQEPVSYFSDLKL